MIQRYSFSTQRPDQDSEGEYVRWSDVRWILRDAEDLAEVVAQTERDTSPIHSLATGLLSKLKGA